MSEVKSRTLREEEDTYSKDETPEECDTESNPPGCRVGHGLRAEVDAICHKDSQCHKELI